MTLTSASEIEFKFISFEIFLVSDQKKLCDLNVQKFSSDIMDSRTRRTLATRLIETAVEVGGIENISNEFLWEVLSAEPIHNEITVYGCVMCPHLSGPLIFINASCSNLRY
tara:strand:- start:52 stop:384 length:333 start_codon:yes stop_codon:yes gene_type:complete